MYYVYILLSETSGILYKGHTADLEKRVAEHNSSASRYTSKDGPWVLVYSEEYATRSEAMKREKFFKSGKGRELLKEIVKNNG